MNYGLTNNSWTIGDLVVEPAIAKVDMTKTPDGARWAFPVAIDLHGFDGEHSKAEREPYVRVDGEVRPRQFSWGVRGMSVDMCIRHNNENVHLARAVVSDVLTAGRQGGLRTIEFPLFVSAQAIAFAENARQSKDMEIGWHFAAETFWMAMDVYSWRSPVCQPFQYKSSLLIQKVPREPWIAALRALGLAENILVEVPLMRSPENEWRGVWNNLVAARRNFDHSLWNETVRSVRAAFEAWQVRWKESGKPWKLCASNGQGAAELDKITKQDRLTDLLYVAKRFADKAAHSTDDDWTRDDALLAISLCTGLWNAIRPNS
ncbi:MAG: hypothetical protein KF754_01670 [Planctomycetes bacterium]|nr:hypothetical protein [Planctomycetota bacterium]